MDQRVITLLPTFKEKAPFNHQQARQRDAVETTKVTHQEKNMTMICTNEVSLTPKKYLSDIKYIFLCNTAVVVCKGTSGYVRITEICWQINPKSHVESHGPINSFVCVT